MKLDLARLWAEEAPTLRRRAAQLAGWAAADDAVAEAFTRLAAELREGRIPPYPRAALAVKVRDQAVMALRRQDTRLDPLGQHRDISESNGREGWARSHPSLEHATFARDFDRAMRQLPDEQRAAFTLTELRGLTVREAAAELGVSKTTAAAHSEAARTYLERTLS